MNRDNVSFLDKQDTYSVALLLLYASSDNPRFSTLNELIYILDYDSFMKFMKYFEGQTIQVPTMKEMTNSLRLLMLFQYSKVDKMSWHEALKLSGFSPDESYSAKHKLDRLCSQLDRFNYKLGGLINKQGG